jgi:hypothetical protein
MAMTQDDWKRSLKQQDAALEHLADAHGSTWLDELFAHEVAKHLEATGKPLTHEASENLCVAVRQVMDTRRGRLHLQCALVNLAEWWAGEFGVEAGMIAQGIVDEWRAERAQQPTPEPALAGGGE